MKTSASSIRCTASASLPSRRASMVPRRWPMPERVIRAGRVEDDGWVFLGVTSADELAQPLPGGQVAVPLPYWKEHREALLARRDPTGVWLGPFDEPGEILPDFDALGIVAVLFPKFTDGRGY